jgi:hypothetical protein
VLTHIHSIPVLADKTEPDYPTLVSNLRNRPLFNEIFVPLLDKVDGPPIPFGALSGLAAKNAYDTNDAVHLLKFPTLFYAVEDYTFGKKRILEINTIYSPPRIAEELFIKDEDDVFASFLTGSLGIVDTTPFINPDKTINVNLQGVDIKQSSGLLSDTDDKWFVVSTESAVPGNLPDLLYELERVGDESLIRRIFAPPGTAIVPPAVANDEGFSGVAYNGPNAVITYSRPRVGETNPRIAVFNPEQGTWVYYFYPIDPSTSQRAGAVVQIGDIAPVGEGYFIISEIDDQQGFDAAVKRLYLIGLDNVETTSPLPTFRKFLVEDFLDELEDYSNGGQAVGKIQGIAVESSGSVFIVNNNFVNTVNGNEIRRSNLGEIQFRRLGEFFLKIDSALTLCTFSFNGDIQDCT